MTSVTAPGGNPLVKLDYSGTVVKDTIKGGGTKTEIIDDTTVTTTYTWNFTAYRPSP